MAFHLASEPHLIRIAFAGAVVESDLVHLADELLALEAGLEVTPPRIIDLSGVTEMQVGFRHIWTLAQRRAATPPKNPIRSAMVAREVLQVGFARMYQTLNDHPLVTMQIFPDTDPALAWLRADRPSTSPALPVPHASPIRPSAPALPTA